MIVVHVLSTQVLLAVRLRHRRLHVEAWWIVDEKYNWSTPTLMSFVHNNLFTPMGSTVTFKVFIYIEILSTVLQNCTLFEVQQESCYNRALRGICLTAHVWSFNVRNVLNLLNHWFHTLSNSTMIKRRMTYMIVFVYRQNKNCLMRCEKFWQSTERNRVNPFYSVSLVFILLQVI